MAMAMVLAMAMAMAMVVSGEWWVVVDSNSLARVPVFVFHHRVDDLALGTEKEQSNGCVSDVTAV